MNPYESPSECPDDHKPFDWPNKGPVMVMMAAMALLFPYAPFLAYQEVTQNGQSLFDALFFVLTCGLMAASGIGLGCFAITCREFDSNPHGSRRGSD